jgi:ABC-type transporter Mla subunit MlaD
MAERVFRRSEQRRREILSALGLAGVFAVIAGAAVLSRGRELLYPRYRVAAVFESTGDLAPGAAVKLAGMRVGRVESIAAKSGEVLVGLSLEKDLDLRRGTECRVRQPSQADGFVELLPGTETGFLVRDGSARIPGHGPPSGSRAQKHPADAARSEANAARVDSIVKRAEQAARAARQKQP